MDTEQLESFIEVGRTGGFTRAAASSFRSQPTLSRHVAAVEREVGARLLTRGVDGARLTPAGEAFLERAVGALEILRAGASAARHIGGTHGDGRPVAGWCGDAAASA